MDVSNHNFLGCIIFKYHIDVISEYILFTYDLNGNSLDRIQVASLYSDDNLKAEVEKSCVIKDDQNIIIQTKIPVNGLSVITETFKLKDTGKIVYINKKEESFRMKSHF